MVDHLPEAAMDHLLKAAMDHLLEAAMDHLPEATAMALHPVVAVMAHLLDRNMDPVLHHSLNRQPTRLKRLKMPRPAQLRKLPSKQPLSLPHRPLKPLSRPRQSLQPNKPRLPWLVCFLFNLLGWNLIPFVFKRLLKRLNLPSLLH
jgi:hypothetical protein